ncbi:MAG: hypothetical protein AAGJ19_12730 [Myxococcota bacterium]
MSEPVCWASVLRAWSDAGEAPPVSIVAAVIYELANHENEDVGKLEAEQIDIGAEGEVQAEVPPDLSSLIELLELGLHGLLPGRTGDLMPPRSRAGLERFRDWDGDEADGRDALRSWLRSELGPLASAEEVRDCVSASSPLDPELPTLAPRPRTHSSSVISSLRPRPPPSSSSLPSIPVPELAEATEPPTGEGSMDLGEKVAYEAAGTEIERLGTEGDTRDEARTIVRHESTREQPVSIPRAPAARRSAAPRSPKGDSILMPAEGQGGRLWTWIILGLLLGGAAYLLLMG